LQEVEKHTSLSRHIPRKKTIFSNYPLVMSHFIDVEPPCLTKAIGEQVWKDSIKE
jgi:hypothetical protein